MFKGIKAWWTMVWRDGVKHDWAILHAGVPGCIPLIKQHIADGCARCEHFYGHLDSIKDTKQ